MIEKTHNEMINNMRVSCDTFENQQINHINNDRYK